MVRAGPSKNSLGSQWIFYNEFLARAIKGAFQFFAPRFSLKFSGTTSRISPAPDAEFFANPSSRLSPGLQQHFRFLHRRSFPEIPDVIR